jgi:hypothetical protein
LGLPKEIEIFDSVLCPIKSKIILFYEKWIKGRNSTIFENKINNYFS